MPERRGAYQESADEKEVTRIEKHPDREERQQKVTEQEVQKVEKDKKK